MQPDTRIPSPTSPTGVFIDGDQLVVDFPVERRDTFGEMLQDSFRLLGRSFGQILLIYLLFALPLILLKNYLIVLLDWQTLFLPKFLFTILIPWVYCAFTEPAINYALLYRKRTIQPAPLREALVWSMRKCGVMLIYTFIPILLSYLGLMLLVVPGIVAMVFFAFVTPITAIESPRAQNPLALSLRLISGRAWPIFGLCACSILLAIAVATPLNLIVHSDDWLMSTLSDFLSTIVGSFATVTIFTAYLVYRYADADPAVLRVTQLPPPPYQPPPDWADRAATGAGDDPTPPAPPADAST